MRIVSLSICALALLPLGCAPQDYTPIGDESADLAMATYSCSAVCGDAEEMYASCAISASAAERDAEVVCGASDVTAASCELADASPCNQAPVKSSFDWQPQIESAKEHERARSLERADQDDFFRVAFRGLILSRDVTAPSFAIYLNEGAFEEDGELKCSSLTSTYEDAMLIAASSYHTDTLGESCQPTARYVDAQAPRCSEEYVWAMTEALYGTEANSVVYKMDEEGVLSWYPIDDVWSFAELGQFPDDC